MPRYEFSEGSSNKFWEIVLSGKSFTTTFGKIGANGQSSTKTFKTEAEAKKEYDKLIAEKTKKGYELADGAGGEDHDDDDLDDDADDDLDDDFDDEGDDLIDDDVDDEPEPAPAPKVVARPGAAKGAPAAAAKPAAAAGGGGGGARYFEFVEGSSAKFWEIHLLGDSFTTRYGKIGTPGQKTVKEFDSAAQAKKEYEKLVAEKTKKGYLEKKGGAGKPTAKAAATKPAKAVVHDDDDEEEEDDDE